MMQYNPHFSTDWLLLCILQMLLLICVSFQMSVPPGHTTACFPAQPFTTRFDHSQWFLLETWESGTDCGIKWALLYLKTMIRGCNAALPGPKLQSFVISYAAWHDHETQPPCRTQVEITRNRYRLSCYSVEIASYTKIPAEVFT